MTQTSTPFGPVPEHPGGFPARAPELSTSPGGASKFLVKGAAFLSHQTFLNSRFSVRDLDRVRESLSAEDREALFAKTALPVSQIPLQAVLHYLLAADHILGKSDLALFKDCLRFKAQQEARGVYRVFMFFVSPVYIIKNIGSMWKHMYSQGETHFETLGAKSINLRITNAPDMPKYQDLSVLTYGLELMRMCNCDNPRGYILKSTGTGDDSVVIRFEWD